MSVRGTILAAVDEIAANRLRNVLSVLSVVVGVATITLIVALGDMGQTAASVLLERTLGRSATLAVSFVQSDPNEVSARQMAARVRTRLTNYGAYATAEVDPASGRLSCSADSTAAALVGVDGPLQLIRRLRVVSGRWLVDTDGALFAPTIVINTAMMGSTTCAMTPGDLVRLQVTDAPITEARLVGIVDDGQSQANVYLPATSMLTRIDTTRTSGQVVAWVSEARVAALMSQVRIDVGQAGYQAEVQQTDDAQAGSDLIALLSAGLAVIAALTLLSGGLGILNLGLATVGHRTREFALRRALGATKQQVLSIVLLESVVTALIAGLVGIILAYLGTAVVSHLAVAVLDPADIPPFPLRAALVGLLVAALVGIVAGLVPARRASRISIISAIRD